MAKKKEEDNPFLDAAIEQQLVTALTIQPGYVGAVQKIFPDSSVFQDEPSRLVYETIMDLHREGAEIRSLAVFQRLRAKGQFSIVSMAGMSLREGPFIPSTSKEILDTAEAVMSNYRRSIVTGFLYKLSTDIGSNKTDQELTEYVFKCYQALAMTGNAKFEKTSKEANDEALEQLEKNIKKYREGGITGVPTGSKKIDQMTGGWQNDSVIVLAGRPAMGKCYKFDTEVVMFDGSVKRVIDIQIGDQLMGPDSTPRNVLSITSGMEEMYWIRQNKGDDYCVNESHILSLKRSSSEGKYKHGEVINISVKDYLSKSEKFRRHCKGYKVGVEFPEKQNDIDPYFLGLWLGDGDSGSAVITKPDQEIHDFLIEYADRCGLNYNLLLSATRCARASLTSKKSNNEGSMTGKLHSLGVLNNKHIPSEFLINSRNNRLALLAGLLDSDGYMDHAAHTFEVTQKSKELAIQIKFLADSLGFATSFREKTATISSISYSCQVYRVRIWGNIDQIPTKIKRKQAGPRKAKTNWQVTGITVEPAGYDKYYGFELDGDHLHVLKDFTVTHNTSRAISFMLSAAESGVPCGFISMEMGAKELKFRQWANYTGIPYSRMRKGEISNDELVRLQNAASEISKLPIWYIDDVDVKDIVKLTAVVSEWKRKYKLGMLFVDYIQYLESDEFKNMNDTQRINHVMKQVKTLNRNLQIPIMALAQLNRDTEGRGNPRPSLADLKGSGQIEQDASIVIGLFNPVYYQRQGKPLYDELAGEPGQESKVPFDDNAYLLYFLKFRDGEIQRVDQYANLATCRFSDYRHLGKEQAGEMLNFKPSKDPDQRAHDFATNKVFDAVKPSTSFPDGPELPFDINDLNTDEEPPF